MKEKLLTIKQAGKKPGVYELIADSGVFNCRLLTGLDDDKKLCEVMEHIQDGGLVALVVYCD